MTKNNKIFTPYYAVIFTSVLNEDDVGYSDTSSRMVKLAKNQEGFLGLETARSDIGITVSYWQSIEAIANWKNNSEHLLAQNKGKDKWYKSYKIRICKVEREYEFNF